MRKVTRRRRPKREPVEEPPRDRGVSRPFSERVGISKKKDSDERTDA